MPINTPLTSIIPNYNNYRENEGKNPRNRQETPLCRIFGCKKEDVFLGLSVSQISDEYGRFYANEDYETSCLRCYKVFGFKSVAVVRNDGYVSLRKLRNEDSVAIYSTALNSKKKN